MTMTATEIKALRRRLGLTQLQFANRLGVSVQAVYYWERGLRTPTGLYAATLDELARQHEENGAEATLRSSAT